MLTLTLTLGVALTMDALFLLKYNENGCSKSFRLVHQVSSRWKTFCTYLRISSNDIQAIKMEEANVVAECWKRVMERWLEGCSEMYPPTWKGLYTLLDDMELVEISKALKKAVDLCATQ